ncbi:MAG TPA: signal recognition particle-docking protein FtsY [Actinomycetota bacterium]|nr:signal recognition particle-docking protein FtsY [Actinomycetota bacterium]
MHAEFWWYILVFGILAFFTIFAFFAARKRRRTEMRDLQGTTHTGQGHVRDPAVAHAAEQRHAPAPTEAGASGGAFRADGLGARLKGLFRGEVGDATWKELEDLLLKADVGPTASADLVERVRGVYHHGANPSHLLRDEVLEVLGDEEPLQLGGEPAVVLVVGVNGSGKTTTIGKLAKRLVHEGRTVSLAAADTFRAAAGDQLEVWARRAGAQVVGQERGADPSAVAFDAVKSAQARGVDVLIVDTAGRLHTKQPLMDELRKVKRVIENAGAPVAESLLVLDAQTGQNGIAQAHAFTEAVELTGVVLTKTDGSAKGGIVLAVREELGLPIRFVGVGEKPDDLRPFDPAAFAERLLS